MLSFFCCATAQVGPRPSHCWVSGWHTIQHTHTQ